MYTVPSFPGLLTLRSNRFAFAAAAAVAVQPGKIYNPLWIYGPTGTGKTALLQAMLLQQRNNHPLLRTRYYHAEDFIHRYFDTIRYPGVCDFHDELSDLDVIVVDHLNTLAVKSCTQIMVGKLLSELVHRGCQVVLASTHTPRELKDLRWTLTCRCEFFLQADIFTPTPRERLTITRQIARELEISLPNTLACRIALAANSPSRIRCILLHLSARQRLLGSDAGDMSEILNHLLPREVPA